MEYSEKVIELLNKSYSPFHVVDNLKGCLEEKGFKENYKGFLFGRIF